MNDNANGGSGSGAWDGGDNFTASGPWGGDSMTILLGLKALDRRERHIIFLRFFEDMTQEEVAHELGISQVHVSRLLRGAIDKMRTELGA